MKNIFELLKKHILFSDISYSDFSKILSCMNATTKVFDKNQIIVLTGNKIDFIGLVLSGNVKIIKETIDGKENIINEVSTCECFGEVFACANITHSPVSVIALEKTEILFLDYKKIITTCSSSCIFHAKLIENMLKLIAQKNLVLNQKIDILSKRTIRERLLLYFDMVRKNSEQFTLALPREELAAYLCVDRSALSNELSKMQKEQIIEVDKNRIKLIN